MTSSLIRVGLFFCILAFFLVNITSILFEALKSKKGITFMMISVIIVNGYLVMTN